MTDAQKHIKQENNIEYQIRVDGEPVYYPYNMNLDALDKYAELCKSNPNSYVDIVEIQTRKLFTQAEYHQMRIHFKETKVES